MEIRNIISFLKVNELSSFSKAADALGYTQSNISSHIRQLEKELKHPLFERFGKTIDLTEYGKAFLPHAYEIMHSVEQAKLSVCDDIAAIKELRIGILESLCTTYMPQIVSDFHKIFPAINIIIKIGTFHDLSQMLNNNQIDFLWTFERRVESEMWIKALEQEEEICVIASPRYISHAGEHAGILSLEGATFIFTEKSCSYRNLFEQLLISNDVHYNLFMEIGNTEIIKKFVNAGLCLSVLPYFSIKQDVENNHLKILPISDISLHMYSQIFYHKNKYLTPVMSKFLELLKMNHAFISSK